MHLFFIKTVARATNLWYNIGNTQKEVIFMGPGFGGPPGGRFDYEKVERPKSIKEVPHYLKELFGGFFYRLGYIFVLVWRSSPLILFTMVFIAIFDGVMPVIGSMISATVLDELHLVIQERILSEEAGIPFTASFWGSAVLSMLIVLFVSGPAAASLTVCIRPSRPRKA